MQTPHKLAWALRAAANAMEEGKIARFKYSDEDGDDSIGSIKAVLEEPDHDWKLVKPPVVTHEYYISSNNDFYNCSAKCKWNMHITLIDGVPQKEVEFR